MFKAIEKLLGDAKNEHEFAKHVYKLLDFHAKYNEIKSLKINGKKITFEYVGGKYLINFTQKRNKIRSELIIKESNNSFDEIMNNFWNDKNFNKVSKLNRHIAKWLNTLAYSNDSQLLLALE